MLGIEHAYASMVALGTGLDSGWPMRYISEAVCCSVDVVHVGVVSHSQLI